MQQSVGTLANNKCGFHALVVDILAILLTTTAQCKRLGFEYECW